MFVACMLLCNFYFCLNGDLHLCAKGKKLADIKACMAVCLSTPIVTHMQNVSLCRHAFYCTDCRDMRMLLGAVLLQSLEFFFCERAGGVQKPQKKNLIEDPKGTLGISDQFGFTKKNEVHSVCPEARINLDPNPDMEVMCFCSCLWDEWPCLDLQQS